MTLHAAQGRGADLTADVVLEPGGGLTSLSVSEDAARATTLLVESDAGWQEITHDAAEAAAGGRIEDAIDAGYAASGETAAEQSVRLLNVYAFDTYDVTLSHTSAAGPQPYVDYAPGDLVGVRTQLNAFPDQLLVMSVSGTEDGEGHVTFSPELSASEGVDGGGS
jgi:hypothetical protein